MNGWIKIHRSILKWEWYQDSKMVHLFIHLLFEANFDDRKWRGMEIKRGQLVTGRKALSAATGISQQSIRTCLARLEHTGEITRKSTNKYSIITINNYNKYQIKENPSQPTINQQSTSNQPHNKKYKKEKNKNIYPDWLDLTLWTDFQKMRKTIKKPMTDRAEKLIINKLTKFREAGHNVETILNNSIEHCWQSVFEPKGKPDVADAPPSYVEGG